MIKQVEQIKQIATELGIIFEDDAISWQCAIKIPSAYYVTMSDYIEDPSTIYIFRYDEERIIESMCFNKLIFDAENDNKLIWVGEEKDYASFVKTIDAEKIKKTLIKCMKEIKEKEEELKIKNLGKDFE